MIITALVENKSQCELKTAHGLSLYIQTPNHKILFDVGSDDTLFVNAKNRNVDLTAVDTVILSHGHIDHGGALDGFLKINPDAKVYAQRKAFDKYYSKISLLKADISLNPALSSHPQVVTLDGDFVIDEELTLFTTPGKKEFYSVANDTLYDEKGKDDFSHEQNLMILGGTNTLLMGCGHSGIVNILRRAQEYEPKLCIGGYHLWNPITKQTVPEQLLECIAQELAKYDITYYTCHCTGQKAYEYFAKRLNNMNYLYCGQTVEM